MEKNFENIPMQEIKAMASSPAGRQLLALLQQKNSAQMDEAMEKLRTGDAEQAKQLLKPLLDSPEIAQLLRQLGG